MRFRITTLVLLLISTLVVSACGQAQTTISAEEIMQRMEAARDAMQDIRATVAFDFTSPEKSGSMLMETWLKKTDQTDEQDRPINMVRIEVREASEAQLQDARFVSDGETFWVYHPDENRVLTGTREDLAEQPMTDAAGAARTFEDMLQRGLDAFDIEVLGEEQIAGQNTWKLRLTPASDTQQQLQLDRVVQVTMWVDEELALPLRIDVNASDMGQALFEVRSLDMDSGLSADLFTFTVPEGAEVVDVAELAAQMRPRSLSLEEAAAEVDFVLLSPADLPLDATLVDVQVIGDKMVIQNYVGSQVTFSIVQSSDEMGAERQPPIGSEVRTITVREQEATLITSGDDQPGSLLRWIEDDVRIIVAGTLSADDAVRVAEALQ